MKDSTVLFVDDAENWYDVVKYILQEEGYKVLWAKTRSEARHLLKDERTIIAAIVNLNLNSESSILDGTGYLILGEIKKKHPSIPTIAISAIHETANVDSHGKIAIAETVVQLYSRYKVCYVAIKGGDNFANNLVNALSEAISKSHIRFDFDSENGEIVQQDNNAKEGIGDVDFKHPLEQKSVKWLIWNWQSSDGTTQIPEGVIREVLLGLDDETLPEDFLEANRDLLCALSGSREDRRIQSAVKLWETLWVDLPGSPYLPLMHLLATEEFLGQMYSEYRDHVAHSIWVYFLGLLLYRQNPLIHSAIQAQFSEADFVMAWKMAALFHDIGYTGDKGLDDEEGYLAPLLRELQYSVDFPLRNYLGIRGIELSEAEESELAKICGRFSPRILDLDNLEMSPRPGSSKQYILDAIEHIAQPTLLGQRNNQVPLRSYYLLGKNVRPSTRSRFRDHGILSALILLQQFDILDYFLSSLEGKTLPDSLPRKTANYLGNIIHNQVTSGMRKTVHQAAAAIALHNIDKSIWDFDKAGNDPYCLSMTDFRITLSENSLAFLLALTDVIQCWDRPKRRYVNAPQDLAVRSQDVRLSFEDTRIIWSVGSDPTAQKPLLDPKEEIESLSKYLSLEENGRGIKDLLFPGEFAR